jgi:hypothetical protein
MTMATPGDDKVDPNASDDTVTQIGKIEFRVAIEQTELTPAQREQRVEALTAWLLQRWQLERQEQQHVQTESAA